MSGLFGALAVVLSLALQAGAARLWPGVHAYLDVLLVPVALYAVGGSQRSAMWIGCASGLLHDAWFEVQSFGVQGFNLTLIGWLAGGMASRVDLNHGPGRVVAGVAVVVGAVLVDLAVSPLLGRPSILPSITELIVKALSTGLLTVVLGSILDRMGWSRTVDFPR